MKPKPKPRPMPSLFMSKEGIATFWFIVAALALIGGGVYAERQAATRGLRTQFIIMGGPDALVRRLPAPPVVYDPDAEHELVVTQTQLLLDSVFNKSSSGLDNADRCQRMMSPDAWQWVEVHLMEPQKDAFVEAHLHQKVAVERITVESSPADPSATVSVAGQLIRTGILRGDLFNQVWSFSGTVVWTRNPSLRDCGRFPLLCTFIDCREKPVASTPRHLTPQEESSLREHAAGAPPSGKEETPPTKP